MVHTADAPTCTLIPGLFGILVQGLLFCVCVGILVFKKWREGPVRTWTTFLLDSSKQLIGAFWIHILNLLGSRLFSDYDGNECEWYWINIMLDTTIGVGIEYLVLLGLTQAIARCCGQHSDLNSGQYRGPNGDVLPHKYLKQLAVWILVVTIMKGFMAVLMAAAHSLWISLASWFLQPVSGNSEVELVLIMIITPLLMNAFQFWVVDNIIKGDGDLQVSPAERSEEGEDAPLLAERDAGTKRD